MRLQDVKVGTMVRFHPIIGGKHDQDLYHVLATDRLHGRAAAWFDGKSDCVDVRALSVPQSGADNYGNGHPPVYVGVKQE